MPNAMGFTGNICATCGGSRMVRTGACECCQDCGTSSGCSRAKNAAASIAAHALGAALALALSGCAMPSAEQGKAAQGGSTGPAPAFTVTVSFAGPVNVTSSSVPTAAPAASSTADAKQDAKATTDVKADATIPAGAGGLSLSPPTPEAPKPEPKPGE